MDIWVFQIDVATRSPDQLCARQGFWTTAPSPPAATADGVRTWRCRRASQSLDHDACRLPRQRFPAYNSTPAHHWASNTISYNITGLNSAEQFLAQTAMQAWSEVANITFVQTSGAANITFTTTAQCRPIPAAPGPGAARSPPRPSISATTGSPPTAARTTARPASTATATRPISTKSVTRSALATRGRTMAARRIRPTRSTPTTPGNIPSCRISRSRIIPGVRTATWSRRRWRTSTPCFDVRRGDLDANRRHRLRLQQQCRPVFNFAAYTSAPALTIYDSGGNDTLDCSGYSSA